VTSHGWYHLAPFRWSGRVLERTELLGGEAVDLRITHRRDAFVIEGASMSDELCAKLTRMFQLDVDIADFHELASASPAHAWVAREGYGRLLCGATLFEDAVKIVLTTNTMWRQTVRMNELLVEKCGRRSASGRAAFPEPDEVARFTAEELQADCRLGYRAKSIAALARFALTTPSGTSAEMFASYRKLPGIGPYGAAHLLAMDGRHDFIAVDTEFRRFVRQTYHGGRNVADATMLRRYSKWGRWKYLAYWSELHGE